MNKPMNKDLLVTKNHINHTPVQGFLMRQMNRFFEWLGYWVAGNPWKIIIFCSTLTIICAIKAATTKKENDLLAYAPVGARSRYENAVYQEFFGQNGQGIMNYVLIEAKDNGTMIRVQQLKETVNVLDNISKNFKIFNKRTDKNQSFEDFCSGFCQINEPVRQFYNGLFIQDTQLKTGQLLNSRISLKYPTTMMFSRKFSIQASFFGVELFSDKELDQLHNDSTLITTNIKKSSMIVLQFRAENDESWSEDSVMKYEQAVANYYMNDYQSPYINVLVISPSYVAQEIERNGLALQPLLIIGFLIMCIFTIGTTLISSSHVRQTIWQKIWLSLAACITPLMACVTAFGLAFFCGLRFSPMMAVTPFLVLAIGVDDSFLMTFKLHKTTGRKKSMNIEQRIVNVCTNSGPSVCLSSITNILAFLVGSMSATPEIQLFNIVNAIALTIDLIYSLTLYAAILTLYGRKEQDDSLELEKSCWQIKINEGVSKFLDYYVRFLTNLWVNICILIGLIIFWVFMSMGAMGMGVDLRSEKFFLKDSKLLKADSLKQSYVTPIFTALVVIVNNPGNLSDIKRMKKLEKMVHHLEKLPNSIGPESTKFFLNDYKDFMTAFNEMDEEQNGHHGFDTTHIEEFFNWPEYQYWRGFLQLSNDSQRPGHKKLDKFFFTTGYSGSLLKEWSRRHEILDEWRHAVDKFPTFNATIFYEDALFLDLISVLPSSTWSSALATLACMALVCYLFISDLFTVLLASLSIFSICIGEFGLLYYSGITLDPISMSALIMSIGFSVDQPSHIAYHFHSIELGSTQSIKDILKATLSSVGYPVLQAGISTILCLVSLLLAPLYMSEVFVLCMTYCIALSLLHALLIIPVILSLKFKFFSFINKKNRKQSIVPNKIALSIEEDKF